MGLNDKLRETRKKIGMTQEDVEKKTGINKKTISNWENGVSRPDVDSISLLCSIYGIDPNDLFDWKPVNILEGADKLPANPSYYLDPEAAEIAQEIYEDRDLRLLFDASRKVSKDDIQLVIDMVKRLKGDK